MEKHADAPPDLCSPQPVTVAPFAEWLCGGQTFDCCLYRQLPGPGPFALPTEQLRPCGDGTILDRLRELEAELARLREVEAAALAFVSAVTAPEVVVLTCRYCDHVATMVRFPGGAARCDRHANGGTDLPYAPAWRRLRKAVER